MLDPRSWDDTNDSYFLSIYKNRKGINNILALCFTQTAETYHHWRIFAAGSSGVCIKFKRHMLIKEIEQHDGVKTGEVKYMKLDDIRNEKPAIDELPFIKRQAFADEREFRVIYESDKNALFKKDIPIPLSCISKITLTPWAYKSLNDHVKAVLKNFEGCKDIDIVSSTLINNFVWKTRGGGLHIKPAIKNPNKN